MTMVRRQAALLRYRSRLTDKEVKFEGFIQNSIIVGSRVLFTTRESNLQLAIDASTGRIYLLHTPLGEGGMHHESFAGHLVELKHERRYRR